MYQLKVSDVDGLSGWESLSGLDLTGWENLSGQAFYTGFKSDQTQTAFIFSTDFNGISQQLLK